ncbi:hypothetical protein [Pseudalgibacter alginicilyticus]|nr:hypothetical protein [Pseudalgibacter alginicilyticus]
MKPRWYISIIIFIFTLIGIVSEQQISVPNQEIVLQFADSAVSTEETQNTLEIVKAQLQNLGVKNIQIEEFEAGSVTITYYSDSEVAIIKQSLSQEKHLTLDYTPFNHSEQESKLPSDKNTIAYNLDVHEIQKKHDSDWDLNGTPVPELKTKSNHCFNCNVFVSFIELDVEGQEGVSKIAYKVNRNMALSIDDTSRSIPEVRAGPMVNNLHSV